VDVSAGWLNYGSGYVKTTRLLYKGNLIDIAAATPDRLYDGIFTGLFADAHPRWSVTRTYRIPWMDGEHFEEGYLHGANAGQLALAGASMALDGMFRGSAVSGLRQVNTPAKGASFKLDFEIQQLASGTATDPLVSPTPPFVVFTDHPSQKAAGAFGLDDLGEALPLRNDRVSLVELSSSLLGQDRFSALEVINPDGNITVPKGVVLNAPAAGSISLAGANLKVLGDLKAPGGTISLTAWNISPSVAAALNAAGINVLPPVNPDRGHVLLGAGAVVDAGGLTVDNRPGSPSLSTSPKVLDGGTVSIKAWSADLLPRSLIDVSGGVEFGPAGGRTYGKAGKIEILAGRDQNLPSLIGGHLSLQGILRGYSGTSTGGTLSLQAQMIQIGGSLLSPAALRLDTDFFSQGGFSTFNLTGFGEMADGGDYLPGLWIAPGTKLNPLVQSYLAMPYGGPGGSIRQVSYLKPEGLRAPVNLAFNTSSILSNTGAGDFLKARGDLVFGEGASIRTDALGSVAFRGAAVSILGSVIAPGGRISIAGAGKYPQITDTTDFARATVYLGPRAYLSTAGKVLTQTDVFGRHIGSVLPGGSISLSGNIIAEAGAVLDVSGAYGTVDATPAQLGLGADGNALWPGSRLVPWTSGLTTARYQSLAVPVNLASNAGTIKLAGNQMLFFDATLIGRAGGEDALGGKLEISSGRFLNENTAESNLMVTQSGSTIPQVAANSSLGLGQTVRDGLGTPLPGMGYFTVDTYNSGGFSALTLGGNVEFNGPVRIEAQQAIRVASGGVIRANGRVDLKANYVSLGQAFVAPIKQDDKLLLFKNTLTGSEYFLAPTGGTGELNVTADLIDVGTLSLQGIGQTTLNARSGDIRGNGTLSAAGRVDLMAGQIYPTTASRFNLVVYDTAGSPGTINIQPGSVRSLPLSAAGELNFYAKQIVQGGTLRAPFGTIRLGWDGSGSAPFTDPIAGSLAALPVSSNVTLRAGSETSVSAVDPRTGMAITVPYGYVNGADAWIDPTGVDITASGPPDRRILIGAQNLNTEAGSQIDIRGGGDLYAYRWVAGNGGSKDVLLGNSSFAILPGYDALYDPYAPFNPRSEAFGGDPGYINPNLTTGDSIYLAPNGRVPAGTYTLLPARYALQSGGFLITPQSGSPIGSVRLADGSSIVSGYRFNTLDAGIEASIQSRYELAPGYVVRQRSAYQDFFANTFFKDAAASLKIGVPRLPEDSGRLVLQATLTANLNGSVAAKALAAGRGGQVDISSSSDIYIGGGTVSSGPAGSLFLNADQLNAMGAESLLIGGIRTRTTAGSKVAVNTGSITLDNPGVTLSGSDIVLVSNRVLTLADGASISSTGVAPGRFDDLIFGSSASAGSGNGLMVRMTADSAAASSRLGVTPGGSPLLKIGAGVRLEGQSLTLDSTAGTQLDPNTTLLADQTNLFSGQISLVKNSPGVVPSGTGLVLSGAALDSLQQRARDLNLSSYTSLDLYGTGTIAVARSLQLSAGQIRGFGQAGGAIRFEAPAIVLDNRGNATPLPSVPAAAGSLVFSGDTITLGAGNLRVDQFANLELDASSGLIVSGEGSLEAAGNIQGTIPVLTGLSGANHAIRSGGSLVLNGASNPSTLLPGLGAQIALQGSSVDLNTKILFPSGRITARALTGNLQVGGLLSAVGTAQQFYDAIRYTNGGEVQLSADTGSIQILSTGVVDVSAHPGSGNAGQFSARAPSGTIMLDGLLKGQAGPGGTAGQANIDVNSASSLASFGAQLDSGGFFESRVFRVRTGDVTLDGNSKSRLFKLSADTGSIQVTGSVDASGKTGGRIELSAGGSLTLVSPSGTGSPRLSVAAQDFDSGGKGGSISLQSGSSSNGIVPSGTTLDLQSGYLLDLSVASYVAGGLATPGSSAFYGKFSGTLQLRAPRTGGNTSLAIGTIGSTIKGASSLLAEGYELVDLTASGTAGTITSAVQTGINTRATAFMSNQAAMTSALLGSDPQGLASAFVLAPGVEIINRTGNLTLGTATSNSTSDWSLHNFRYGSKQAPGVLTMRAAGDLVFYNALSDGFTPLSSGTAGQRLWLGTPMAVNQALPTNVQSWSYRLTAGADFTAAASGTVRSLGSLADNLGSILLGKSYNAALVSGSSALTGTAISSGGQDRYQVIRTGTGDISINAGRDVRLLNQFATIYTAGARLATPESIFTANDFSIPIVNRDLSTPELGASQQRYAPTWTMAGGNVGITAGNDIGRYTIYEGNLVVDSSRQTPNNWLYRRGNVDPLTGAFGKSGVTTGATRFTDPASSTAWWVDFSNFFETIGALGGGNVSLTAGNDVVNADAVVPTNARMPGLNSAGVAIAPDASRMVELGGGDIRVNAGRNIDGGTYYVERGNAILNAGGAVTTNQARSPSLGILGGTSIPVDANDTIQSREPEIYHPSTWMPVNFYLGRGAISVSARGDVLLGPVANTFLLPQGINNKYWYKTFFSTYGADSALNTVSLGGSITYRMAVNLPTEPTASPTLLAWLRKQNLASLQDSLSTKGANYQPWIRSIETDMNSFTRAAGLLPGQVRGTAFGGDINIIGDLTLSPSPSGTLELISRGGINGIGFTGPARPFNQTVNTYVSSQINLSDTNPASFPGVSTPFVDQTVVATSQGAQRISNSSAPLDNLLGETGSVNGTISSKTALHAAGVLHANDVNPAILYGTGGDISGLTFYSAKAARLIAERDISDIGLYLQNTKSTDISLVSAGRDLIAFNESAELRANATDAAQGHLLTNVARQTVTGSTTNANSGDIQINGPGVLEVLAGGKIDLGTGANFRDGTGSGITSIGNLRNPWLPAAGSDLIVLAGTGGKEGTAPALGLSQSMLDIEGFLAKYTAAAASFESAYLKKLGLGSTSELTDEQKAIVAMEQFFAILKKSGSDAATSGSYAEGYAAITALFGSASMTGDISGRSRDIRSSSGGAISINAPGGGVSMASQIFGNPLAPPGIVTESGGSISIFTDRSVSLGQARIFTLRGGDITIWSSKGDIAAGSAAKTVVSAPPTRVLIDSNSADVKTDLAGLATGGGIGVLATVAGVPPGDVALIAPVGAVDAGDAGIRSSGNLTIAAAQVLNASNIAVSGASVGTPAPAAPAPAVTTPAPAPPPSSNKPAPGEQSQAVKDAQKTPLNTEVPVSDVTVEVLGYGGSDAPAGDDNSNLDDEEKKRRRKKQEEDQKQESGVSIGGTAIPGQ